MNKISAAITEITNASYPAIYKGPLKEGVSKASLHGYDAVELHIPSSSAVDCPEFLEYCMSKHIRISAISTGLAYSMRGLSLTSEDPDTRKAAIRCMNEFVSLAKELQTGIIIGLIRGSCSIQVGKEKTVELLRQSMEQILNQADNMKVPIYFEVIAEFLCNYFCKIQESVEFVTSFKHPSLKLHIDTFHMAHEESDLPGSIAGCAKCLGYVHYSDTDRLIPGMGTIDFSGITKELKRVGYEGYIALECVPFPDVEISGPFGAQYVKSLLNS